LCHYVFDVELVGGTSIVARVAAHENVALLRSAEEWSAMLRPLGVPLPEILGSYLDTRDPQLPALVLERWPGDDLGTVCSMLTTAELRGVARKVIAIQSLVAQLVPGQGFGYVGSPAGPWPHATWRDAIEALVQRSVGWFGDRDHVELLDRVRARLARHADYLSRVVPTPYLDDVTTKNVIIGGGVVTGIVDVDWLGYGDPLMTPALAKVSLIGSGQPTEYADIWCDELDLTEEQMDVFDAYTALFCFMLLSESGRRFNQDDPQPSNASSEGRLLVELRRLTA
jgi:aminoglycoside phosphotransferase (APT) family kinase protein